MGYIVIKTVQSRAVSSRPIAVTAFAMFRHKEDDRACDAASLATIHSDVKYVTIQGRILHESVINARKMLQETRYQVCVRVDMSQFF